MQLFQLHHVSGASTVQSWSLSAGHVSASLVMMVYTDWRTRRGRQSEMMGCTAMMAFMVVAMAVIVTVVMH